MTTRGHFAGVLGLGLASFLAACGTSNSGTDAGNNNGSDGTATTGDGGVTVTDGGSGRDSGLGTCSGVAIENLASLGTVAGAKLTYTDTNSNAMNSSTVGAQVPSALATNCTFRIAYERAFLYTVHSAGSLRVSTSNAGTTFDTVLLVRNGPTCAGTARIAACNDDDPQFGGDNRRVTSTTALSQVTAGQQVVIVLGGYAGVNNERYSGDNGAFELTVEEVPFVADGGACDDFGTVGFCGLNSTCVGQTPQSSTGTCRANGTVAGTSCTDTCNSGLTCQAPAGSTAMFCANTVADGMPCDFLWNVCGTTSSCATLEAGATSGICRANGSVAGTECDTSGACLAGLTCNTAGGTGTGLCLHSAAAGATCNSWDTVCATGNSCVSSAFPGRPGMCTANGTTEETECANGSTCSGTGLVCATALATPTCETTVADGQPCGPYSQCASNGICLLTNPNDRVHGTCHAEHTAGGPCMADQDCTGTGLTCSGTICVHTAAMGGACDVLTNCPTGASCVVSDPTTTGAFAGHCVADGARGAACKGGDSKCDSGLTCSSTGVGGICQAAASGSCDAHFATDRCPGMQACRASSLTTGTCAMPTAETEPNDVPAAALTTTSTPALVSGGLDFADNDCYALDVPANGRVFAKAQSPSGLCPFEGNLTLDLYGVETVTSDLRLLGTDNGSGSYSCPRIDGSDRSGGFTYASGLPAGRYYVCVRNDPRDAQGNALPRNPIRAYVLSLDVTTAP